MLIASVRGIGVAVRVSTSTSARIDFQGFLLAHAKTVFLVDDDEAEAVEFDVLADQLVRADDDVDLAFSQFLAGQRRFLGGVEAGDFGDLDRPVGEAVGKVW
jgi:hypothetical protein